MKLTIKGLTKNYGKVCALSQFTIEEISSAAVPAFNKFPLFISNT